MNNLSVQKKISLCQMDAVAQELYQCKDRVAVYTLEGPLGAGKTTLVSLLLKHFGITAAVTSPTFTYVNIYKTANGCTLYHFDFYRLHSIDEFIAAGFNEFLYQPNSWAFIEWPGVIAPLLTHAVAQVELEYAEDFDRLVKIEIK